jgi:hypothetical protein
LHGTGCLNSHEFAAEVLPLISLPDDFRLWPGRSLSLSPDGLVPIEAAAVPYYTVNM